MKAVTTDGKTIEIRPGQALSGIDLVLVEITATDLILMNSSPANNILFMDWLTCSLFVHLVPVDAVLNPKKGISNHKGKGK